MKATLRIVGAVLAGLLAAFILIVAVEFFGNAAHPFPEDFGGTNEEMCKHVARFPHWVLAVAVLAWAATAFVGTWIARRIGGVASAAIVALLLLAALVCNVSMLPYLAWFKIASLLAVPAAMVAGGRFFIRES